MKIKRILLLCAESMKLKDKMLKLGLFQLKGVTNFYKMTLKMGGILEMPLI